MEQLVYKTEGVNRTKTVRFHPYVFTGKAPRKGKRIPLNTIKNNEQRDEETGYGYFGARYMDHELMTMWLSVDPMADKYPSISPYAYCSWNPVKLIDPDGNEDVIYLVNLQGKNQKVDVDAVAKEANERFKKMGLNTRVIVSPEGKNFNPSYLDNTDSYAVIGSHSDVSDFLGDHMSSSDYQKYFSDWAGGTGNPERSSKSLDIKTNAIGLDADGVVGAAKAMGEKTAEMGAFLIMHGAGHNATFGHSNTGSRETNFRCHQDNAAIMVNGDYMRSKALSIDYVSNPARNSKYIQKMKETFGNAPARDNYMRNKANARNPYIHCSRY